MSTSRAAVIPLREVQNVRQLLVNDQALQQIGMVAAKHLDPTRIARTMLASLRSTPKLAESEPMSLLGAVMTAASLGLEPNTPLGHAYILPYNNNRKLPDGKWVTTIEAQVTVGYKGFVDLAYRSGKVVSIHADVHYSDDELWEYEYGSQARLRHRTGPQEGDPLHAYCHVKLRDGEAFVVLPWSKVMKTRDSSHGYKSAVAASQKFNKPVDSPWVKYEHEMAAKTAVRYLANRGGFPMSTDFARALEIDGERRDFAGISMDPPKHLDFVPDGIAPDDEQDEPPVDHDEDGAVEERPRQQQRQQQPRQIEHQHEDPLRIPDNLRRTRQPEPTPVPDHITDPGFDADFEAGFNNGAR